MTCTEKNMQEIWVEEMKLLYFSKYGEGEGSQFVGRKRGLQKINLVTNQTAYTL